MTQVYLYDTTLRDGTQGEGMSLSVQDKIQIALKLDEFGVHYIEGGWPGSNPKDVEFFREMKSMKLARAKLAAFGSTRRAHTKAAQDTNLKGLVEAHTPVVTIFGKTWDLHVRDVLKVSLAENLAMIVDSVQFLKSKRLEVVYDAEHFFDGFRANPDYALKTIREAARAGADNLTLCDTNGGSLPEWVEDVTRRVRKAVRGVSLGIHCHNDMELAVANSVRAVQAGAALVHGTINGYGERCGNANLVSVLPVLQLKLKYRCVPEAKLAKLTELSHYVAEVANMPIESNQPFTGKSAFAHKGGVHINAMTKTSRSYEHLDPRRVGNRRRFLISELAGRTNILAKARELNVPIDKDSDEARRILSEVQKRENEGYQYEAAEASFELLVREVLGRRPKHFNVLDVKIDAEGIGDHTSMARALVKVADRDGREGIGYESGNGPVDALAKSLTKALRRSYPVVDRIHLTDYKVRVVDSKAGTAAKVRVFIQFQDNQETWTTVGVDKNIIEASWQALVEAIEYKLLRTVK